LWFVTLIIVIYKLKSDVKHMTCVLTE
jgi:hypothetical protein